MMYAPVGKGDNLSLEKLYENLMSNFAADPAKLTGKEISALFAQFNNLAITKGGKPIHGGQTKKKVDLEPANLGLFNLGDVQKLVDILGNEDTQLQLEMGRERLKNLSNKLDAAANDKNIKLENQVKVLEDQEKQELISKILAGLAMALAIVIAVATTVATGGLGTAAIVAIVAAAFSVVTFVMDVSGANEAIVESIAKDLEGANCNASEAKLKAAKIWGYVQIAVGVVVAAATFGAGTFGTAAQVGAKSFQLIAQMVSKAAGTAQLALGIGQLGFGIYTLFSNKNAAEDEVELITLDKYLSMLRQHLEEEEEFINQIMELLDKGLQKLEDIVDDAYQDIVKQAFFRFQYG